jgi:hypothetical protein
LPIEPFYERDSNRDFDCQALDLLLLIAKDVCATMFDWAKFRQTKGAVKLHLLLDHDGYLPSFAVITEGEKHEVRVARQMQFARGIPRRLRSGRPP